MVYTAKKDTEASIKSDFMIELRSGNVIRIQETGLYKDKLPEPFDNLVDGFTYDMYHNMEDASLECCSFQGGVIMLPDLYENYMLSDIVHMAGKELDFNEIDVSRYIDSLDAECELQSEYDFEECDLD